MERKPTHIRQVPWDTLTVMREKDGHTMASLAKFAGISPGYLNDLEKGRRDPSPVVTRKLAKALNVPASSIEKYRRHPNAPTMKVSA